MTPPDDLLHLLDQYLDAAPRRHSDVVDSGTVRAFVSRSGWHYYGRPVPGLTPTAADLAAAVETLRAAERQVSFEWVQEVAPAMAEVTAAAGLDVTLHPLLVLTELCEPPAVDGVAVRPAASESDLRASHVVAELAFAAEGGAVGPTGPATRDSLLDAADPEILDGLLQRVADGSYVAVVAESAEGIVGSAGMIPVPDVPDVVEIVGVGVLPSHRRRGIGAQLTAELCRDAAARGIDTVMLSAGSDAVARGYERLGFVRVGRTADAAEPDP